MKSYKRFEQSTTSHLPTKAKTNTTKDNNTNKEENRHPKNNPQTVTSKSTQDKNSTQCKIINSTPSSRKLKRLEDIGDIMYGVKI